MKQRPEGGTWKQTIYSQGPEGGCGLLESPEDHWERKGCPRGLASHLYNPRLQSLMLTFTLADVRIVPTWLDSERCPCFCPGYEIAPILYPARGGRALPGRSQTLASGAGHVETGALLGLRNKAG